MIAVLAALLCLALVAWNYFYSRRWDRGVSVGISFSRPATYVINTFLDAKADELVDIFSKGTDKEKKAVYEILTDIDPTRVNTYDRMNE